MREARIESIEGIEMLGDEVRLSANDSGLEIVFPREVWTEVLASAFEPIKPTDHELAEIDRLREGLLTHARDRSFNTILEDVQCGGSGLQYALVLRAGGLLAATTGYHFDPVVSPELMARIGVSLEEDQMVEQAYVIGAVVDPIAMAAGDESLRALSIRGHRCSTSRFEMAPELWRVLHEKLGWKDVQTVATEKR